MVKRRLQDARSQPAATGDIVTLEWILTPEAGFVPEPLFDTSAQITFTLGWGNYLPGLHELVTGCAVGDSVEGVSIDAGWGERRDDLVLRYPRHKLERITDCSQLVPGESTLYLTPDIQVLVLKVNEEDVVLDANPPLAGSSYLCSFTVLAIESLPPLGYQPEQNSRYRAASFALGCFWGNELAFMRTPGVVGTKVGYSQGLAPHPTYEEVCTGRTQHRESALIIYDSTVTTYAQLVEVALGRLRATATSPVKIDSLFHEPGEDTLQYQYGFYYMSEEQEAVAKKYLNEGCWFDIELLQAKVMYDAEDYMQQYLYKRGQSARKGAKEPIRCYG